MAYYDEKPSVLEAVGNGSFLYRFNIEEENLEQRIEGEEEPIETKTQWRCDEVTVWAPLSSNKITEAVIATLCPATHEQKLVNEFNAANLGLLGSGKTSDEARLAIAKYKEFLDNRKRLKEQVDADCAELGIA